MPEFVESAIPCAGIPHFAKFVPKLSQQMIEEAEASSNCNNRKPQTD
jgi:hypothetical protein